MRARGGGADLPPGAQKLEVSEGPFGRGGLSAAIGRGVKLAGSRVGGVEESWSCLQLFSESHPVTQVSEVITLVCHQPGRELTHSVTGNH